MMRLRFVVLLLTAVLVGADINRVSEEDITFFLSNNRFSYEEFTADDFALLGLDRTRDIKIICHGWIDSISSTWYIDAKAEYDIRGGANVIGVDWSPHASTLYSVAVGRTEGVGFFIALMIVALSNTLKIPLSQFHITGHSLGAHIAGFAGQHVLSMTGNKIGRISGLDPAGPSFEGNTPDGRLSDDDADFVDVMHTDAGTLGYRASIGHVDYFPNGGSRQSGCSILLMSTCSHNRAPSFFYESINSNGFVAVACSSAADFTGGRCNDNERIIMGENVDQSARGDFYLRTAGSKPFALG